MGGHAGNAHSILLAKPELDRIKYKSQMKNLAA